MFRTRFWAPQRLLTIGVLAAATTVLVAACSSEPTPSGSTSAGSGGLTFTATTPAASGTTGNVKWNLPAGEPTSLDYAYTWDTGSGATVLANLCDNLMRQNPDGTITPALASAVATPDATTYVYDIRSGVTFTDGKALTANDVAFSLNRQIDPKVASYWALWFANVKSIAATGPLQVTVKMNKPDVLFGELMATPAGAVVEKAYAQAKGKDFGTPAGGVMCTGPFSLTKWSSGQSIDLTANPNYWDATLKPKASSFTFSFLRDPSTITNGLVTGTIDGTWRAPVSNISVLQKATNGKLYVNESSFTGSLLMSSFDGALKNVQVRQALQKSIDYAGIVKGVLQGAGQPAAAFTTPATFGYARDIFEAGYKKLPPAVQDLNGAKALITQAGGAPTAPIVIAVDAGNQAGVTAVTSIQDSARQVGLTVQIKTFESAAFANVLFDPNARKGLDMVFVTSTTDLAEPLELYAQALPGSPYNWVDFKDPGFVDPMTKALSTVDPTARASLIVQGQAVFADQVGVLPVYSPDELLFMSSKITGPPVSSLSSLYYPWAATVGAA